MTTNLPTVLEAADTPQQAQEVIQRLLAGQTWTSDELMGNRTEPAFDTLFRDYFHGNIEPGLNVLITRLAYPCDGGTLFIERTK